VGVTPTIEVPFTVEYAQGKDPQLERAIEFLSRSVRG
jgi:carboxyl-terminal processing protease